MQWTPPSGKVRDYRLTLTQNGSIKKILTVEGTSHSFIDLTPGTQYSVEIESQSGGLYSEAVTVTVTTSKLFEVFLLKYSSLIYIFFVIFLEVS